MVESFELFFSNNEYERRHKNIRAMMQERDLDCLIITGHTGACLAAAADTLYVAGVRPLLEGAYIVFPFSGQPVNIVGNIAHASGVFPTQMASFKKGTRVRDWGTSIAQSLRDAGLEKGSIGIVSTRTMAVKEYLTMSRELPEARFVPADDIILQCRLVKSIEEIAMLRRSASAADAGLKAIVESARPGVTENDLVIACDQAMAKAGGERGNFILVGSGPWDVVAGAFWPGRDKKLEKGDFVFNEITSNCSGYYTQLCCPIFLGSNPPAGFMKRLEVHKAMQQTAYDNFRTGSFVNDIDKIVEERAATMGEWRRAWALQSAELAESWYKVNLQLQQGMCYVIHPWAEPSSGEGFIGHTVGYTCVTTEHKPEVLHKTPQDVVKV